MTWSPIFLIDFLLIWFFLYWLLRLFRDLPFLTNLVLGISLLLMLYFAAQKFQMGVLYWLLERVFLLIPLFIVILLQPEIRSALERTAFTWKLAWLSSSVSEEEKKTVIQEILKASRNLLQRSAGGLIVIENNVSLEPIAQKGIPINGDVGTEILESIFSPQSVLHDGAVIIRQGKIRAAACTLPLSSREDFPVSWGLRHRAAIGISETSDALAVVISEDSRAVSLAHRGNILFNLSLPSLEKEILLRWK